jgi:hypothetical protein
MEKQFSFQDLEIWQKAAGLSGEVFAIADTLDAKRKFRFAEQLRAAALEHYQQHCRGIRQRFENGFRQFSYHSVQ